MRYKRSFGEKMFDAGIVIILLLIAFVCLYPFYYMLIYAFSSQDQIYKGITLYPRGFTFSNFAKMLKEPGLFQGLLVSVSRTVVGSGATLLCCSFFAYLCSKRDMYGRKFIYRFVVITMYLSAGLIPTYLAYRAYGLRNTFWIYILPTCIAKLVMAEDDAAFAAAKAELLKDLEEAGAATARAWWEARHDEVKAELDDMRG